MDAEKKFVELQPGVYNNIFDDIPVKTCILNHPIVDLGYAFEINKTKIVYISDFEHYTDVFIAAIRKKKNPFHQEIEKQIFSDLINDIKKFIYAADILIIDAEYSSEEYKLKIGWGHSTYQDIYELTADCNIKKLCFFHHSPIRKDDELLKIETHFQEKNKIDNFFDSVFAAREGMTIKL